MAYRYTTWEPSLETGHAIIDKQHKQLIRAVNSLFDAQRSGKGRKEIEQTMAFLVDYTIEHFADEEEFQVKYGYPDYLQHKKSHEEFKETVRELASKLHQSGPTVALISNACLAIGRWVVNHIKTEDLQMAAYIRNKEQSL